MNVLAKVWCDGILENIFSNIQLKESLTLKRLKLNISSVMKLLYYHYTT